MSDRVQPVSDRPLELGAMHLVQTPAGLQVLDRRTGTELQRCDEGLHYAWSRLVVRKGRFSTMTTVP